MPRDISRNRDAIGAVNKVAPKVEDPAVQRGLNDIYAELNKLKLSVNSDSNDSQSRPNEGKDGDIRLYSKRAADGTLGFFIQGKFGENWASGRLGIDLIDPMLSEAKETAVTSYETVENIEYITAAGVTFENLSNNDDVTTIIGSSYLDRVAAGNHTHTHTQLTDILNTHYTHSEINTHIDDGTKHRLRGNIPTTATVSNTASQGSDETHWANADHVHKLDTTVTYNFTSRQTIAVSAGSEALQVDGNVDINGDVDIAGNLTVDFAESGTGDTDVSNNFNAGKNVVLNDDTIALNGGVVNDTHTTTVHGVTTIYNDTKIQHQPGAGESQLEVAYDANNAVKITVNDSGTTDIVADGNIILNPSIGVLPEGNMEKDLGSYNRKWRTLYAAEMYVENLVAQDVMATIGGRIMVAPTTQLTESLSNTGTTLKVKHNIFEPDDFVYLKTAPGGIPQHEAIKIVDAAQGTSFVNAIQGVNNTIPTAAQDHWPDVEIDVLVSLVGAHNMVQGQYITVTDTNQNPQAGGWTGVHQVYFWPQGEDGVIQVGQNSSNSFYLALPANADETYSGNELDLISFVTGPYVYTNVARNQDGTGANTWSVDDSVVNLGHETGDGYIELTSTQTIHNELGPAITLFGRRNATSTWDNAEPLAHLGQLNGYAGYSDEDEADRRFGAIFGKNLTSSVTDNTTPFTGMLLNEEGIKLYNSDMEIFEGSSRSIFMGMDALNRPCLALGNNLNNSIDGQPGNETSIWNGNDFLFAYDNATNGYKLTLSADVNIINSQFWDNATDMYNAIDHFEPGVSPGTDGFYVTPYWMGFYDNNGSTWPIKIGRETTTSSSFLFAGDPSGQYIEWKESTGKLTISGEIEVLAGSTLPGGQTIEDLQADAAAGGWDGSTGLTLTDTITISGGSITIGNVNGSSIKSSGMVFNDNTSGFILGRDTDGHNKFIVSDGQDSSIVFNTNATDKLVVKGNLHADRLANVTPKISDGVNYRNLTIAQSSFDGPFDRQNGWRTEYYSGTYGGDQASFASEEIVVSGVRNGALMSVTVYAEVDDKYEYGGSHSGMFWINPRIAYHSKSFNNNGDLPLISTAHWSGGNAQSGWRLGGNWKEVDWINNQLSMGEANEINGVWMEMGPPENGSDSYWNQGSDNIGLHDNMVAWTLGQAYPYGNYSSDMIVSLTGSDNSMGGVPWIYEFRMKPGYTANTAQQGIIDNLWSVYRNVNPGGYYTLWSAGNNNQSGDYNHIYKPGTGTWDETGDDYGAITTNTGYIAPATAIGPYESNGSRAGQTYTSYGHNGARESLWQNLTADDGAEMLTRRVNAGLQYWNSSEGWSTNKGWSKFTHTYVFKVDIPGLESMSSPGEIVLHFGTGLPFSPYATWEENYGIDQVDFKITVFNQG